MSAIKPAKAVSMAADAIHLSSRPLPEAPMGTTTGKSLGRDREASRTFLGHQHYQPRTYFQTSESWAVVLTCDKGRRIQAERGFTNPDPKIIRYKPEAVDDRKGAFQTGLDVIAKMDPSVPVWTKLNNAAVNQLYNTIPHPPTPDGGGNNLENRDLGRASVGNGIAEYISSDPGLIFDTILKRKQFKKHAGGMSSMIFAFASIVTHSLFRTRFENGMIYNDASSYLTLAHYMATVNEATQHQVRDKASGRGLLYPDTFAEERLLFLPPASSAYLPPPTDPEACARQDEQIFQTAKLVNCGHFMSCIMGDYVPGFLGVAEGCNWNLQVFDSIKTKELTVNRGQGNHCSIEFNILYRWHATTAEQDVKGTEDIFNSVFNGKPFDQLSRQDLAQFGVQFAKIKEEEPYNRTFSYLKRGPDGRFSDEDIANVLKDATDKPAGSFGGRGTPGVLRVVEIMGIQQARAWGACTMNEFRRFLGLKAESTMPLSDGLRFACGYTTTRGVLGDAVALVRGDRFSTIDFSPANYTTWGFKDCQRDLDNGGFGGQLPKLFTRTLPDHYPYNSVYTTYPFFVPSHMKESLERQGTSDQYTFERPGALAPLKILNTFTGIKTVFNDLTRFNIIYANIGYGSILMFDDIAKHDNDKALVLHALFPDKDSLSTYTTWLTTELKRQLKRNHGGSYTNVPGTYVNIVDVINMSLTHFSASKLTGIPLKTKEILRAYSPSAKATFLAFDDPVNSFALHSASAQAGSIIGLLTAKAVMEAAPTTVPNAVGRLVATATSYIWPANEKPNYPFHSALASSGRPLDQLVVGGSVNHAQGAINVVDFYLDAEHDAERKHIIQLAHQTDKASTELLRGYVREAMRFKPQFAGLYRKATGPGLPPVEVKAGDRIWSSFRNAHRNPIDFPNPDKVDPRRPVSSYNLNGTGFHGCPGTTYAVQSIAEIVRTVFSLPNIRRAPGPAGKANCISEIINETETDFYIQRDGTLGPWTSSMHLVYDA
ncbi:heme peroxidase [Cyathus striatus]|nr:heme peroxidase [Cyathus striatus]